MGVQSSTYSLETASSAMVRPTTLHELPYSAAFYYSLLHPSLPSWCWSRPEVATVTLLLCSCLTQPLWSDALLNSLQLKTKDSCGPLGRKLWRKWAILRTLKASSDLSTTMTRYTRWWVSWWLKDFEAMGALLASAWASYPPDAKPPSVETPPLTCLRCAGGCWN